MSWLFRDYFSVKQKTKNDSKIRNFVFWFSWRCCCCYIHRAIALESDKPTKFISASLFSVISKTTFVHPSWRNYVLLKLTWPDFPGNNNNRGAQCIMGLRMALWEFRATSRYSRYNANSVTDYSTVYIIPNKFLHTKRNEGLRWLKLKCLMSNLYQWYTILCFDCHAIKNKNANHSIQKVQNLGNQRRWIYKTSRQESGLCDIS